MGIIKNNLKVLTFTLLCLICFSNSVLASGMTEYGIKVEVSTEKESYEESDDIDLIIDIKNENKFPVTNISVNNLIPDGLEVKDSTQLNYNKDYLLSGERTQMIVRVNKNNNEGNISNLSNKDNVIKTNDISNNANKINTGDKNIKYLLFLIIVSFLITIYLIKYNKNSRKKISLFLVIIFSMSIVSQLSTSKVNASEVKDECMFSVKESINIDNKYYDILVKFTSDPLNENLKNEDIDTDKDGICDYLENYFGTDINNVDTDGDKLTDYQEVYILDSDPLKKDSDDNGIEDSNEDCDKDGLKNLEEFSLNTEPNKEDTDCDGISDGDEVNKYKSNPLLMDTDSDKLDDNKELEFKANIINPDTDGDGILDGDEIYETSVTVQNEEDVDQNVQPLLDIKLPTSKIDTLKIEKIDSDKDYFLSKNIPGYMGSAYNFSVDGTFESATLTFKYDEKFNEIEGFDPAIYYFDEENQTLIELSNQTVSGNSVSVQLEHFSAYILMNRTEFKKAFEEKVKSPSSSNTEINDIDISFVLDISASMTWNDSSWKRKDVANEFINTLEDNDRASLISFTTKPTVVSSFTTDKIYLDSKISLLTDDNGYNSYSGTDGSAGLDSSIKLFQTDNREASKYIIFLTDGEDTQNSYSYSDIISRADNEKISIYTIGLGSSVNTTNLKNIANGTGGEYFHANEAKNLFENFQLIKQDTIDYKTDSNNDGISDYYTKLIYEGKLKMGTGISFKGFDLSGNKDYDGDGLLNGDEIAIFEYDNKVYVKVLSDPTKVDTDYDGINDNVDLYKMDNNLNVNLVANDYDNNKSYKYSVDFKNDFSWFFSDNTKYNKDMCVTSSILAGMAYHRTSSDTPDSSNRKYEIELEGGTTYGIVDTMKYIGYNDVKEYNLNDYYNGVDQSQFDIGHKKVTVNGETKNVVLVTVRGTFGSLNEWTSNFDMGDTSETNSEWTDKLNHKGFDITTNRIKSLIEKYLSQYNSSSDETVFWITGHSRGAAISNLLGAKLEDEGYRTFTYTFATPNTTTSSRTSSYDSIFNIVNEDDFVPNVPVEGWNFKRFGSTATIDMSSDMETQWDKNTGFLAYNQEDEDGLKKTINALTDVMDSRDECKKYSCDCHGDGSDDSITTYNDYSFQYLRNDAIAAIPVNALPYCKISEDDTIETRYKVEVCQTPMFFMQLLAAQSSGIIGNWDFVKIDVAKRYEKAKMRMILSGFKYTGGLAHPHYVDSYYLIANKSKNSSFK